MQVGQLLGESSGEAAPPGPLTPLKPRASLASLGPTPLAPAPAAPAAPTRPPGEPCDADLDRWLAGLQARITAVLTAFVRDRCAEYVRDVPGAEFVTGLLSEFVAGGKFVRSTFTYLGWLSGAEESDAALRAAASTELVHAFALLQDDVMDRSALRRGRPAVHMRLAEWYGAQDLGGPAERFGESAAVLLADLLPGVGGADCCVTAACARGARPGLAPVYDTLRGELAVGQFADLIYDTRSNCQPMEEVLEVTRRKSGNYTVRRPLELGAALAGCDGQILGRARPSTASWSARRSSCATTCSASSGGRRSPASPTAATCGSARRPAWSRWPGRWPRPVSGPGWTSCPGGESLDEDRHRPVRGSSSIPGR